MATAKLFLRHIPFRVSDAEIAAFVAPVGVARKVKIPVYADTGLVRGYAFVDVTLEDGLTAEQAAEALDQTFINDAHANDSKRCLDVQVARPEPAARSEPREPLK